jgi:hypothetical protein
MSGPAKNQILNSFRYINFRIQAPQKETKIGQNNSKNRRSLSFERGLMSFLKKLIVIGAGPHYQKQYQGVLESFHNEIALLIDLEDKEESIRLFFQKKALKPRYMLFLQESLRNALTPALIHSLIAPRVDLTSVDGVILSTEPKARKAYALWAAECGLPVFMDKPTSAFSDWNKMDSLLGDFEEIEQVAHRNRVPIVVSCERRAHPGYLWSQKYLRDLIEETRLPLTGIDIHFAGGIWHLSDEYSTIEKHPFKYGYGILLHSGYHYIDLLATFLSLNQPFFQEEEPTYRCQYMATFPSDQTWTQGSPYYASIDSEKTPFLSDVPYGETDLLLMGQMQNKGRTWTQFSLKLLGTSVSMREEKSFLPFLKGKIRQEHVILHLGHLCSLQVRSNPLKKLNPSRYPLEDFNITILHNPLLKGREPIVTIGRKELSQLFPEIPQNSSFNSYARQWQLREFLQRRTGNSSFSSHRNTISFLHTIYSQQKELFQKQALISNGMTL